MGGNALKHLNPARLTSEGVWKLFWRVAAAANFRGYEASHLVPWTLDKKSHGDVDIVIQCENPASFTCFENVLNVPENGVSVNGPVVSLALPVKKEWIAPDDKFTYESGFQRYAQVDLIAANLNSFRHTCAYFSGGGLGMLLGRVAAAHGLVFGMDGLRIHSCPELPWSKDILVAQHPLSTFKHLGYDYKGALEFETEEDVWRFALSSPLARPWMFVSEATNHENRSRDKQRANFVRFQKWLADNYDTTRDNYLVFDTEKDKFEYACEFDFGSLSEVDVQEALYDQQEKWNGARAQNATWGHTAVVAAYGEIDPDVEGKIIRDMQPYLPNQDARRHMYRYDAKNALSLATTVARAVGAKYDLKPKE